MGNDYQMQRQSMVENQIKNRGVKDKKVIEAMLQVPREIFIPENRRDLSYYDGPLEIGYGQTISQPYIVAYMTELLELKGNEKVLEIGTGSGYQTSVLARIAHEVFTIEIVEELGKRARNILNNQLSYGNIHYRIGNGREGWSECAPYDRIILTAAPIALPQSLFGQLNENGMVIAPVGDFYQQIVQYRKSRNKIKEKFLIGVSFVPLV